jgi:nucleotide-binding universal stress UspA family protein
VGAAVVEEAQRWGVDLIVVGTHGRRGLDRLLLGSVAEGVARTAPVSVPLVRGGTR